MTTPAAPSIASASSGLNSLGFARPPAATRVVVAMSGGVDSSVTAAWLARQGYDVVGITLQLYDQGEMVARSKTCCAGQDIYDARTVADRFGFPHYVIDQESRFRQSVIDDFADSYLRGETPIPCVRCNQTVKFTDLLATARDLGGDCLATGHYVQRVEGADGPELHRAVDTGKDQSYFLFATTPAQLAFLRFPLGGMTKAATRALAHELGVPIADKPDSQDICFVPTGDYAGLVRKLRPGAATPGPIVDLEGRELGRHEGTIHFTIGQRKGLGIGGRAEGTEPLYVVRIDPASHRVVVGPKAALARSHVYFKQANWLGAAIPESGLPVRVRLRSAMAPATARVFPLNADGTGTVVLDAPHHGVAPGQAAVFYALDGTQVLGGGWITGADAPALNAAA